MRSVAVVSSPFSLLCFTLVLSQSNRSDTMLKCLSVTTLNKKQSKSNGCNLIFIDDLNKILQLELRVYQSHVLEYLSKPNRCNV